MLKPRVKRVVIIGGGTSGVLLAKGLQRSGRADVHVTLITKRQRTSLADKATATSVEEPVPEILEAECVGLSELPDGIAIKLSDGTFCSGDAAILATGWHTFGPPPQSAIASPRLLRPDLVRDAPVLILGANSLAIDYVLQLISSGYAGKIYLLSHHGRMPLSSGSADVFEIDLADIPIGTGLAYLLRWMRSLIRWCGERGFAWQGVVDGLKPHAATIWRHLSLANRRRFLAHAKAWWDAYVHRLAPEATESIRRALESGQLTLLAGRLTAVDMTGAELNVTFQPRGRSPARRLAARHIVNCEDIPQDIGIIPSSMIRSLIDSGLARPDALDLGLDVSSDCEVIRGDGTPSQRIYAIGPPTRGAFFSALELPGISMQSEAVIRKLLNRGS